MKTDLFAAMHAEVDRALAPFDADEMNALQDSGIISDLCVSSEDIATADRERAREWLGKAVKQGR